MNHANVSSSDREGSAYRWDRKGGERLVERVSIIARRSPRRSLYYDSCLEIIRKSWCVPRGNASSISTSNDVAATAPRSWCAACLTSDGPVPLSRSPSSPRVTHWKRVCQTTNVEDGAAPWPQSYVSHQPRAIHDENAWVGGKKKIELNHWLRLTRRTLGARVVHGCLFNRVHVSVHVHVGSRAAVSVRVCVCNGGRGRRRRTKRGKGAKIQNETRKEGFKIDFRLSTT